MGEPRYRQPRDVAVVDGGPFDDGPIEVDSILRVYVARVPNGPATQLEGSAALIWWEALAASSADVTTRVAEIVGVTPAEIRADVETFLDELVACGLLERDEQ